MFHLFSGAHGPRCPTSFVQHHRVAQHGGILLMETRRILPNLMYQTRFSSVTTRGSCATFLCWRDIKWGKWIILFLKRDVSTSKMLAMEKFFFFFFLNFLISVILLFQNFRVLQRDDFFFHHTSDYTNFECYVLV